MLNKYIDELNKLDNNNKDYLSKFENILEKIADLNNQSCIQLLLLFFNDNCEYDKLMFSIIHAIEIFDDDEYVDEIMEGLPVIWANSKRWTIIIHMRMINSPLTFASYKKKLSYINYEQKSIVREILKELVEKRIEFTEKAKMIYKIIE